MAWRVGGRGSGPSDRIDQRMREEERGFEAGGAVMHRHSRASVEPSCQSADGGEGGRRVFACVGMAHLGGELNG